MNINFPRYTTYIIGTFYIVIIFLIVQNSYLSGDVVKDISLISISFFSLLIALLLYDRFDYRKKIFERKLDACLELLSFIKSTKILIFYQNNLEQKYHMRSCLIDKEQLNSQNLKNDIDLSVKVVFEAISFFKYLEEMNKHKTNPFLPKEIVKSLNFLTNSTPFFGIERDITYQNEYIKISVNDNINNIKDLKGWSKPSSEINFEVFINNYINVLNCIENWINKHSNFDADLNL